MSNATTVKVRLIEHGEMVIEVPAEELKAAVADGGLQALLDPHLVHIPTDYVLVDDRQFAHHPYALVDVEPRPSLLGSSPTDAIAAIIEMARPIPGCNACETSAWPARGLRTCSRHVAERLIELVRTEDLIVMPTEEADRVIATVVEELSSGATRPE